MISSQLALESCERLIEYMDVIDLEKLKYHIDNKIKTNNENQMLENFNYKDDVTYFDFEYKCFDYMRDIGIYMRIKKINIDCEYFGDVSNFEPVLTINDIRVAIPYNHELLLELDDDNDKDVKMLHKILKPLIDKYDKTIEQIVIEICDFCVNIIDNN